MTEAGPPDDSMPDDSPSAPSRDANAPLRTDAAGASDASPAFRLSRSPAHLLRRAQQFTTDTFSRAGLEDNVTLRQAVVLAAIAEAEGSSQADLVNATGVDRSTLAEMIARMERKGLIARTPARDDLRAKAVHLTPAGRQKLDASLPLMQAADATLLAALPKARRAAFLDMLTLLANAGVVAAEAERSELRAAKLAAKARKAAEKAALKANKTKRKLRKKRRRH